MRNQFDLIVIGSGAAASAVAHECGAAGWKVAVVDSMPFGRTCALCGCDPKKVLVGVVEMVGRECSHRMGEESAGFKVLIEDGSERVLGAHVIGPHADELINVFALAMQADIPASQLRHAIFGYPTLGSDVKYML